VAGWCRAWWEGAKNNAFRLGARKASLLEFLDDAVRVDHERLHVRSVYHLNVDLQRVAVATTWMQSAFYPRVLHGREGSMRPHILAVALFTLWALAHTTPVRGETVADGRIVRVVYKFTGGGSWGFQLAHMKDGRYCVRFGNPGRIRLAVIDRVADICFDDVPGTVNRSRESRSKAMDVSERGKQITLVTYQKGSIAAMGDVITLDITSCVRVEGENKEERCSPNQYVVHMNGANCDANIILAPRSNKIDTTTCEHYPAE
jgi:hypothetical protein